MQEQNARSNTPEAAETEFASLEDLLSEIKLAFQVPSGKASFHGRTRVARSRPQGQKNASSWLHLIFGACPTVGSGNANKQM